MSRYIDADALIKDIESRRLVFTNTITVAEAMLSQGNAIRKAIEEAPTADVVEVVRCKDCRRWTPDGGYGLDLDGTKRLYGECSLVKIAVKENHFCYFGSRSKNK